MDYNESQAHYIVTTCLIIKDGKVLITKRSAAEKNFPNKWTVPGGKLESKDYTGRKPDTSSGQWYNVLEELTRREVLEEVGLRVKNIRHLANLTFIRSDNVPVLVLSLYADYESGEVKLEEGLQGHEWVDLEAAKGYDLIDGIYEEIEMLYAALTGKRILEWKKG